MSTRIATSMTYSASLQSMLAKQASLNKLQQQLATGQKLVTAKSDPIAAGTAVKLDHAASALEQYAANASRVSNRLGLQENALTEAGELMTQVNELTVQANNPSLSNDDLKSIATQLRAIQDQLLAIANSTDGTGRYLFGGANDGTPPFVRNAGTVSYAGDQTWRQIEVAPGTVVRDALPGSEVFMRIPTGDGVLDANPSSANAGSLLVKSYSQDNASGPWNGKAHTLTFTAADQFEIHDADGALVHSGTYTDGEDITFGGLRLALGGTPAIGDSVTVGPAGKRDVFSTLESLCRALETPATGEVAVAARTNQLQSAMRDVARGRETLIDSRANGGAQLAALDTAANLRDADATTLQTSLSSLRDLDYAEAVSRYQLESTALQAAQTIFTQMQSMSLFNALR